MSNIVLLAIFSVNLAGFCLIGLFFFILFRLFRQFKAFIYPEAEGKPSPAASVAQALADMVARSLVMQIKATFMGKSSGESRAQQAAMGDVLQDQANVTNPLIGGLIASMPGVRKWLVKNPAALDFALSKLGNLGGSSSGIPSGSNGGKPVRFKL